MDLSSLVASFEALLEKITKEMIAPKPETLPERIESWTKELSELRDAWAASGHGPYAFVGNLLEQIEAAAKNPAVIQRQEALGAYDSIGRALMVGFMAVRYLRSKAPDRHYMERQQDRDVVSFARVRAPVGFGGGDGEEREDRIGPPGGSRSYLATRMYRVWFGTDRKYLRTGPMVARTSSEWSPKLTLGSCLVYVPRTHKFGSVGSSWITRKVRKIVFREEDDRLLLKSVQSHKPATFCKKIGGELARWSKKTALVFVHGYNVDFEEAAIRAAQIGFDLRVDGITAFFSWPSKGELVPYTQDEANVELSENHFVEFLMQLAQSPGLEEINILAHSMGNRLLCRTVPKLVELRKSGELALPIGQIVLAAADLTTDFFHQYAALYPKLATRRVTNYSYKADIPLLISRGLHGISRVGLEPPIYIGEGIDTVSASELELDLLGHGYFAKAEPLLYDISDLMHNNQPPSERRRIEPGPHHLGVHWVLSR